MASINSVSLLSEAAFGCGHLATVMKSGQAAGQFKDSFIKANRALAPLGDSPAALFPSKSRFQSSALLRPRYICLSCSESCLSNERRAHTEKTGHQFYMDSRARNVYCQGCDDFVYDHELERLRSPAPEVSLKVSKRKIENSADELFVRSNASKRPCARQGVRGLWNLGQSCFMNVILQALLHDPILHAHFLGNGHQTQECTITDCVGCSVAEAFTEFNTTEKPESFVILNLLAATWRGSDALAGYRQQDAHEFYQFLVDKLHSSDDDHVDDYECPCFFHKTFHGKLRSTVTCDKCANVTQTEDPMVDLSLDVQVQAKKRAMGSGIGPSSTATLKGCLDSFTSPEHLMADAYNCDQCGTPQKATKQLQIKKLPAILCLQLKRYEHTFAVSEKVEGRIDFPLSLNMLPYTTNPDVRIDRSKYVYDLSTAVVHKGKLDAGHYYAYCRQGDQWVLFNDDRVTVASEAEVLNADAYLLFYSLRTLATARS